MSPADWLGWTASAFTLATFCMRDMVALRSTALASNLAFMAYGASADIAPVLILHTVLLPLNAWRLAQHRCTHGWPKARPFLVRTRRST